MKSDDIDKQDTTAVGLSDEIVGIEGSVAGKVLSRIRDVDYEQEGSQRRNLSKSRATTL